VARRTKQRWSVAAADRRLSPGARRVRRLLVTAAVIAALMALDRLGWGPAISPDMARYDGRAFFVVRVVDGDTLDVHVPDGDKPVTRVRLWGIDAPEIAKPWEPDDASEPGGEAAKAALASWAEHRLVFMELLPHRVRDDFGRILAYVRDAHGTCLNELLVREGYAPADGRWWHPDAARYEVLGETARRSGWGVWGAD